MSGIFGKFKKNNEEQNTASADGQNATPAGGQAGNAVPEETSSAASDADETSAGAEGAAPEVKEAVAAESSKDVSLDAGGSGKDGSADSSAGTDAEKSDSENGSSGKKESSASTVTGTEKAGSENGDSDKVKSSESVAAGAQQSKAFEKISGQEEVIVEGNPVPHSPMDDSPWSGDNPRRNKIVKLEKEARRRNEVEQQRTKWMQREQEYLDRMIDSVEQNMRSTQQQKESNERFQRHIQLEVYRMHGISEDKLQGMEERRAALYQGTAFALFFLSIVMIILCGVLHGFDHGITLFMAFYTAVEASLLTQGRRKHRVLTFLTRILYLALFPIMLVEFVFFELKLPQYEQVTPIFTIAGVVVLILGAIAYFAYDPYTDDRANRKKADKYIKKMGKSAQHDIRAQEKELEKRRKKEENKNKKDTKK